MYDKERERIAVENEKIAEERERVKKAIEREKLQKDMIEDTVKEVEEERKHDEHDEHEDHDVFYHRSKWKKLSAIIIGILMIGVILSFYLTGYGVGDTIVSLAKSSTVNDDVIYFNSSNKVIFSEGVYDELLEVYDANVGVEFKVCLNGKVVNGDYYIDDVHMPVMYTQEYNKVVSEPCPAESLVDLHSHPPLRCIPSDVDIKSFSKFKKRNPQAMMAVMCERGRMNFYR